jgi:ribosome-binding protein aMBF1 (putative translation factor)
MAHRAKESEAANIVESYETRVEHRVADEIAPTKHSIKDEYKDQFEKAIEVAQHHLKQWVPKKKIVNLLNESGFKTRTGKKWSYSTLANELKKLNRNIDKAEAEKIRNKII